MSRNSAEGTKKRILVAGAYGTGNVGDEALLAGALARFSLSKSEVIAFSNDPLETVRIHGIAAERKNPKRLVEVEQLLLGGGELFQPGMAAKYSALILAAAAARTTVDVEGVGVSPNLSWTERRLTAFALRRARRVTVRDAQSAEQLRTIGIPSEVVADLSFSMPSPAVDRTASPRPSHKGTRRLIGLNLRRTGDLAVDAAIGSAVIQGLRELVQRNANIRLVLLPFSRPKDARAKWDDIFMREILGTEFEQITIECDGDPHQMLATIASLDTVVSMRFHPMVFAHRMSVPVIGLAHYWKVREFAREHGLPVVMSTDSHAIADAIAAALNQSDPSTVEA